MVWLARPDQGWRYLTEPLRILGGQRELVGLWMLKQLPGVMDLPGSYEAIGVVRGTQLVGGCLYTEYWPCKGGGDVKMWAVGHNWLSRRIIKVMLDYAFVHNRCHRITSITRRKNKASRQLVERLGFKLEGVARKGCGLNEDAMIYGLLKEENRWS